MSDATEEPPPPPDPPSTSATPIFTIPEAVVCNLCTLPVIQGQSAVRTEHGVILHSFCWENR